MQLFFALRDLLALWLVLITARIKRLVLRKETISVANGELRAICVIESNCRSASPGSLSSLDWLDVAFANPILLSLIIVRIDGIVVHRVREVCFQLGHGGGRSGCQ